MAAFNLPRRVRLEAQRARSFRRRQGKPTQAQKRAMRELWPVYGLDVLPNAKWDWREVFRDAQQPQPVTVASNGSGSRAEAHSPAQQQQPRVVLDIGFGNGNSTLELARAAPHLCFCGVEVHKPGVAAALQSLAGISAGASAAAAFAGGKVTGGGAALWLDDLPSAEAGDGGAQPLVLRHQRGEEQPGFAVAAQGEGCAGTASAAVKNVRLVYGDAIMVLADCIAERSLSEVLIFYPDPFPDDPQRRIVRPLTVELLASRLRHGGRLHIATDVDTYAAHVQQVMGSAESKRLGWHGGLRHTRPPWRPLTMYEHIAAQEGRGTWDLCYTLQPHPHNPQ